MRRRFAVVGMGARAQLYTNAICDTFRGTAELVALCDLNEHRLAYHNELLQKVHGMKRLPCYPPSRFEEMLHRHRVDCVIICSIDCTHGEYIVRSLRAGCDALCEKPLATTADACRQIVSAVASTGRTVQVGFNYRYAPRNSRIKELLAGGEIGEVLSVHFEWCLDTVHGADYFRRWHRDRRNSGGMLVHKASHHFDLINWWLDSAPVRVFGIARLAFYGEHGAKHRSSNDDDSRFAFQWDPELEALYGPDAVACDGYRRDQDVFGDGITIEDDAALVVEYASGATLSYHLTCFAPWEGVCWCREARPCVPCSSDPAPPGRASVSAWPHPVLAQVCASASMAHVAGSTTTSWKARASPAQPPIPTFHTAHSRAHRPRYRRRASAPRASLCELWCSGTGASRWSTTCRVTRWGMEVATPECSETCLWGTKPTLSGGRLITLRASLRSASASLRLNRIAPGRLCWFLRRSLREGWGAAGAFGGQPQLPLAAQRCS